MPTTRVLEIIVKGGKRKLREEEWVSIIGERREFLRHEIGEFATTTLDSIPCLHRECSALDPIAGVSVWAPIGSGFSLKTQGIFRVAPRQSSKRSSLEDARPRGSLMIWGITRSCQWVLVYVDFVINGHSEDAPYEVAEKVTMCQASAKRIAKETGVSYRIIFDELGSVMKVWMQRRELQLERLKGRIKSLEHEDAALEATLM